MIPESIGYDRTVVTFSPTGELPQVEYAKKTVERGLTGLGIVFKDGVVLAGVSKYFELLDQSISKIFQVDKHVAAVVAGYIADARVLIEWARLKSQIHKVTYDEPIPVLNLGCKLADRLQFATCWAGIRPYGVGILLGGVDTRPMLIELDPAGMLTSWKASAIGRGSKLARDILEKKYKENLEEEDAIKLAIETLKKSEREKISKKNLEIGLIKLKDKEFKRLEEKELESYL